MIEQTEKNDMGEDYKCDLCEKVCLSKRSLYWHVKNSHKQKHEQCDNCDMKFSNRLIKKRHMLEIHEKINNFTCVSCKASFKRKCSLQRHLKRVHEKLKNVPCESCNKTFSLKRHFMQVHENVKDHHCEMCKESFKHPYTLKNHITYQHKKKFVKCTLCEKLYPSKYQMEDHFRKIHLDTKIKHENLLLVLLIVCLSSSLFILQLSSYLATFLLSCNFPLFLQLSSFHATFLFLYQS